MRLPKKPPLASELGKEIIDSGRFSEIFKYMTSQALPKKYLHWDKLAFYNPPDGMSHKEWWFLIKTERYIHSKQAPLLKDKKGRYFTFNIIEIIQEILSKIDLSAGGMIQMPFQIINPDTKDQYYVKSLIEEAITSSQLEGASTTQRVAKELIRKGLKPKDRSEMMILNNYNTMKSIGRLKDETLTPELIFHIHRLITENTLDDPSASGRFRLTNEPLEIVDRRDGKTLHVPPDAAELPERLSNLCNFANGKNESGFIHPVIKSIIIHFWLAYDHPFCDGNGRTARALFYWSMLRHGYWLFEFISISEIILKSPAKYARAFLYTETDENDLTYFIVYHLLVIQRAIESLHRYITRRTYEIKELESVLHSSSSLNHRQRALIAHALKHPNHTYTFRGHKISHNISRQTARTDLLELVDLGIFESRQTGKTWYFNAVSGFEDRLTTF